MHGETLSIARGNGKTTGLSPRARGNQPRRRKPVPRPRTIPACTGKPLSAAPRPSLKEDYPRVHGETPSQEPSGHRDTGLSPRARGNPWPTRSKASLSGTIPACTGKPLAYPVESILERDYPRVHGETVSDTLDTLFGWGLSPRARGNLRHPARVAVQPGTIPACTGKPTRPADRIVFQKDYPRVHGETWSRTKRNC